MRPSAPTLRKGDAGRNAAAARARRYRQDLAPVLAAIAAEAGPTPERIASFLTRCGVRKPRGGRVWTPPDVRRILSRLSAEQPS
ncbi:hypothetical protein VQ02_19025 [Methylobacterium variabile]|jgi:hypothetical protein|uniref:Recombinase domain-containing protein n=1 Tax=Methylobacterium variabile TaxID=298794 RepID=A0A0J6SLV9_9HYPH|nr:hypothetical protein [Methylobacterium variabile]KMO34649.1 hypothetical protein VQ02_19025 [Methylobacterium variabile]